MSHHSRLRSLAFLSFTCVFHCCKTLASDPVSIDSLLSEMIDRESVSRFPKIDFRLKQHSSYNRASKTPEDEKGWFNNKDNNTSEKDKCFIRIEENNGKKEWVLMEDQGPGAIVRTWMPFRNAGKPDTNSQIRIYLDGAPEPVLEGNMLGLLNGTGLIPYPLAHKSLLSAVSFFPIPYSTHCKVTTTEQPFFYQITYREYADGTPVKTFSMDDFKAASAQTQKVGETLLNPNVADTARPLAMSKTLAAKEEVSIDLPRGTASIRELSVKLGSYEDSKVTRTVVLKMEFDGHETVWCPVGDFFGSGLGLHPFQDWYRTVDEDGTMTCRWVMPYQDSCKASLVNLSDTPVNVEMKVQTGEWKWDERSMYFNAAWRGQFPVPTRPYSDWNYVALKGRGVYVGDTLTIMNPVEKWWGEGDEKIWVDGESFPSIFGTGTEDYYGYSWGGNSTDFYEHPFHAQPRSHVYNKLNRKTGNDKSTLGYSTETRTRSLDTMPFGSSLKLDMEVWSWTDSDMGYQVGAYWYGLADTTSNRKPEPVEVLNVPPLPDMTPSVSRGQAKRKPESSRAVSKILNAVEIETTNIISKSERIKLKPQNLKDFKIKGNWNFDNHLLFRDGQIGDVVELRIPTSSPAGQHLALHATKSFDFGILRFSVNGNPVGADVDLYAANPEPSGGIVLGTFDPVDSAYVLRAEVVGKNPDSKGTFFGLDCVVIEQAKR